MRNKILLALLLLCFINIFGVPKPSDSYNPDLRAYPSPFPVNYWNDIEDATEMYDLERLKIRYKLPLDTEYIIITIYNVFGEIVFSTGEIHEGEKGCTLQPSASNPYLSEVIYDEWRARNGRGAKIDNGAYIIHLLIVRDEDNVNYDIISQATYQNPDDPSGTYTIGSDAKIEANVKISVEWR